MSMWSRYPIVGYQVLPYGDLEIEIDNGVDPATTDTVTVGTEGVATWGYGLASPATGTTAAALATALASHSYWGGSPPTLVATYELNTGLYAPRWRITTASAGVDVQVQFTTGDAATMACLGLVDGDTLALATLGTAFTSTRRWRGLWSPGDEAATVEPVYVDEGQGAMNPYDPAYHDRLRLSRQLVWLCEWGMVDAADISRELVAVDAGLQALANRESDDTQGTLDDLLGAAGSDMEMRLILSSSDSRDCVLVDMGSLRRDTYTREETVGGRRYSVTLGMVQAGAYEGVET
jgi:hypothetical protein